jgi:hypothetical protein
MTSVARFNGNRFHHGSVMAVTHSTTQARRHVMNIERTLNIVSEPLEFFKLGRCPRAASPMKPGLRSSRRAQPGIPQVHSTRSRSRSAQIGEDLPNFT